MVSGFRGVVRLLVGVEFWVILVSFIDRRRFGRVIVLVADVELYLVYLGLETGIGNIGREIGLKSFISNS